MDLPNVAAEPLVCNPGAGQACLRTLTDSHVKYMARVLAAICLVPSASATNADIEPHYFDPGTVFKFSVMVVILAIFVIGVAVGRCCSKQEQAVESTVRPKRSSRATTGMQTDGPLRAAAGSIFSTPFGERFHDNEACWGLRSSSSVRTLTPCHLCFPDSGKTTARRRRVGEVGEAVSSG